MPTSAAIDFAHPGFCDSCAKAGPDQTQDEPVAVANDTGVTAPKAEIRDHADSVDAAEEELQEYPPEGIPVSDNIVRPDFTAGGDNDPAEARATARVIVGREHLDWPNPPNLPREPDDDPIHDPTLRHLRADILALARQLPDGDRQLDLYEIQRRELNDLCHIKARLTSQVHEQIAVELAMRQAQADERTRADEVDLAVSLHQLEQADVDLQATPAPPERERPSKAGLKDLAENLLSDAERIDMRICYEAQKLNAVQIGFLQGLAAGQRTAAVKIAAGYTISLSGRIN
jgi:hypothetical protein